MNFNSELSQTRMARIYKVLLQEEMTATLLSYETNLKTKMLKSYLGHMVNEGAIKVKTYHEREYYRAIPGKPYETSIQIHCDESMMFEKKFREARDIKPFRDPLIWLSYGEPSW